MKFLRIDRTALLMLAVVSVSVACSRDSTPVPVPVSPPAAANAPAEVVSPNPVTEIAASGVTESWDGAWGNLAAYEFCAVDLVNGERAVAEVFTVSGSDPIAVEGWIASPELKAIDQFAIFLQGPPHMRVIGATGKLREDVAEAFGDRTLLNSGFSIEIAAGNLAIGEYAVFLGSSVGSDSGYCDTKLRLRVN